VSHDDDNDIIAYCNHCNANITLEDKDKLRSLIVRIDNDEVVDVQQLYYGNNSNGDGESNAVLIAYPPDAYDNKGKKVLTGTFKEMQDKGIHFTSIEETKPASGTRVRFSSDDIDTSNDDSPEYDVPINRGTKYRRRNEDDSIPRVRHESSSNTNANANKKGEDKTATFT
jgi:hypothetical protein